MPLPDAAAIAVLLVIGLVGGMTSGLLGIGGGLVILPLLIYVAGIPVHLATGVSATLVTFSACSGILVHRSQSHVRLRIGVAMGGPSMVAALVVALFSGRVPGEWLKSLYLLVLLVGVSMLAVKRPETESTRPPPLPPLIGLGLTAGGIGGALGLGGATLELPVLRGLLGVPMRIAIGTSLIVVLLTGATTMLGKALSGQLELLPALVVALGGVSGAQFGARLSSRIPTLYLRILLVVFLLLAGAQVIGDLALPKGP